MPVPRHPGNPCRDIPHIVRRYLKAAPNEKVTADQASAAHPAVASAVQRNVDEYENGDAIEVVVAHAGSRAGAGTGRNDGRPEDFFPSTR